MGQRIEAGMVLVHYTPATAVLPERWRLWTVTWVNALNPGRTPARLIAWAPPGYVVAQVTFPDGEVREPWRLLDLSQTELGDLYARTRGFTAAPAAVAALEAEREPR
jgi:hypothetical protein